MTILAEPMIITTAQYPAEPPAGAARHPHRPATGVGVQVPSRRRLPDAPVVTGLLRRRDGPPTNDRDWAGHAIDADSGTPQSDSIVDCRPLRGTDPEMVADYRLVSRLGAGGMADVFYALAPTGRPVAVKLLRDTAGAPEACQREFLLASAVDADCTARALGFGMSTVGAYLVTAYLPGFRCGTTLDGSSMSAVQLWAFGAALAGTVAAVHARGVVHCDVKPSNLLARGHEVRLIDFGIARYVGERCGEDGTVQCSRGWAAPEQLRTAPATPAVDVFAWGCLLAHMASGVHPFFSRSEKEWILRVQSAEPDLYALPPGLDEVIRATLARDPHDRPTARELATICQTRASRSTSPMPRPRPGVGDLQSLAA
jgi:serine/threonine protein kinase